MKAQPSKASVDKISVGIRTWGTRTFAALTRSEHCKAALKEAASPETIMRSGSLRSPEARIRKLLGKLRRVRETEKRHAMPSVLHAIAGEQRGEMGFANSF